MYTCVGVAYKKAFAANYLHFFNLNFVFIRQGFLKVEPASHCHDILIELREGCEICWGGGGEVVLALPPSCATACRVALRKRWWICCFGKSGPGETSIPNLVSCFLFIICLTYAFIKYSLCKHKQYIYLNNNNNIRFKNSRMQCLNILSKEPARTISSCYFLLTIFFLTSWIISYACPSIFNSVSQGNFS